MRLLAERRLKGYIASILDVDVNKPVKPILQKKTYFLRSNPDHS